MDMKERRELFIRNRDTMQSTFFWDSTMMQMCCAYLYTVRGKTADKASAKQTKSCWRAVWARSAISIPPRSICWWS